MARPKRSAFQRLRQFVWRSTVSREIYWNTRKMKTKKDLRTVIFHVVLVTVLVLLVPFITMQFANDMNWSKMDFIVAGTLVAAASFLVDVVIRGRNKYKALITFLIIFGFLAVWAQLAVGIFDNLPLSG